MFERKLLSLMSLVVLLAVAPAFAWAQSQQEGSDWGTNGTERGDRPAGQVTQPGMAHQDEVSKIQTALRDKGFDPGPIDGVMGPRTRSALRQFQRQNNLTVTGQIDAQTRAALEIDDASQAADRSRTGGSEELTGATGQTDQDSRGTNGTGQTGQTQQPGMTGPTGDEHRGQTGQPDQNQAGTNDTGTGEAGDRGTTYDDQTRQQGTDHVPPSAHGRSGADHHDTDYDRDRSTNGTMTDEQGDRDRDQAGTMTDEQGDRDRDQAGERESRDQAELARDASEVLREITQAPDQGIPSALLREAKGIAVIPGVIKGAFGIGGRWGEGLMAGRSEDGTWGAPSFIEIGGASVGFQIGVSSTDLVLVFTSKDAIDALLDGKVKLGADAEVAAGPVGRSGSVGTDVRFEGPIYSYSRSKGAFAGVSLEGAVITIDDSANQKVYGQNVSGTDILRSRTVQANATVEPFLEAVRSHTPAQAE
jgi:lipid-binding SYLF domain-containing protein